MSIINVSLPPLLPSTAAPSIVTGVSFLELPDDLLLYILSFCDVRSIIKLRCQNASFQGPPYLLERPLASYSASDLEKIVVNQAYLDASFRADSESAARIKDLPEEASGRMFLLEGGRWLVSASIDGSGRVWYFDLDAEDITPKLLFQLEMEGPGYSRPRIAWSIDGDSDTLSFFLAVFFTQRHPPPNSSQYIEITFWRVDLADDGRDLKAISRNAFDLRGVNGSRKEHSLLGETYLRYRQDIDAFEVLTWPDCSSKVHRKAVVAPALRLLDVVYAQLLSATHFLVVSDRGVRMEIYVLDVTSINMISTDNDDAPKLNPVWHYLLSAPFKPTIHALSPPQRFYRFPLSTVSFFMWFGSTVCFCDFTLQAPTGVAARIAQTYAKERCAQLGWRRGLTYDKYTNDVHAIFVDVREMDGEQIWTLGKSPVAVPMGISPTNWTYYDGQSGRVVVVPWFRGVRPSAVYFM